MKIIRINSIKRFMTSEVSFNISALNICNFVGKVIGNKLYQSTDRDGFNASIIINK